MAKTRLVFDHEAFRRKCFEGTKIILVEGEMGMGKTHLVVAEVQEFMRAYKEKPVFAITNIPFARRIGPGDEGLVLGYPPNVFYAQSLEGFFRVLCGIMEMHRFDQCRVIWVLDEAQNYLRAESHMGPLVQAILTMIANFRKFNVSFVLMTPLVRNVTPRIRNGPVDGKPGYCTAIWSKQRDVILPYLRRNGVDMSEHKKFATLTWSPSRPPEIVHIGAPSWTTPLERLPVGGYAYDTGAVAHFTIGSKKFSLDGILAAMGSVVSVNIPQAMREYFDRIDSDDGEEGDEGIEAEDHVALRNREQCLRVDRYKMLAGCTWDDIEAGEGEPASTIRSRCDVFFRNNPSQKIPPASKSANCEPLGLTCARREREKESCLKTVEAEGDLSPLDLADGGCDVGQG